MFPSVHKDRRDPIRAADYSDAGPGVPEQQCEEELAAIFSFFFGPARRKRRKIECREISPDNANFRGPLLSCK